MVRPGTAVCMATAIVSGIFVYSLKHRMVLTDRAIAHAYQATQAAHQQTAALRIEWSMLNDPVRLQGMAGKYLMLRPVDPTQFAGITDLGGRIDRALAAPAPSQQMAASSPAPAVLGADPMAPPSGQQDAPAMPQPDAAPGNAMAANDAAPATSPATAASPLSPEPPAERPLARARPPHDAPPTPDSAPTSLAGRSQSAALAPATPPKSRHIAGATTAEPPKAPHRVQEATRPLRLAANALPRPARPFPAPRLAASAPSRGTPSRLHPREAAPPEQLAAGAPHHPARGNHPDPIEAAIENAGATRLARATTPPHAMPKLVLARSEPRHVLSARSTPALPALRAPLITAHYAEAMATPWQYHAIPRPIAVWHGQGATHAPAAFAPVAGTGSALNGGGTLPPPVPLGPG